MPRAITRDPDPVVTSWLRAAEDLEALADRAEAEGDDELARQRRARAEGYRDRARARTSVPEGAPPREAWDHDAADRWLREHAPGWPTVRAQIEGEFKRTETRGLVREFANALQRARSEVADIVARAPQLRPRLILERRTYRAGRGWMSMSSGVRLDEADEAAELLGNELGGWLRRTADLERRVASGLPARAKLAPDVRNALRRLFHARPSALGIPVTAKLAALAEIALGAPPPDSREGWDRLLVARKQDLARGRRRERRRSHRRRS